MWSWWDPSHRGPAAAEMPSESIKAAAPPSPRFVSRPVAHTQTVTEKNHLLHSMTVFWGFFGALLICRMHSNFQDSHWAIHKNHERYQAFCLLFVLSIPMWWLKKGSKKKQNKESIPFFHPLDTLTKTSVTFRGLSFVKNVGKLIKMD